MDSNQKPDPLDALLKTWKVDKTVEFQSNIWQRIATAESKRINWWAALWETLDSWLPRPMVAVSLCALFIAAGVSIGHVKAEGRIQQSKQALQKDYWGSVDPFQKASMPQ